MAHLAIAYPVISQNDHAWIQTIRQQHDPNYALVAPHFTLVFHVSTQTAASFGEHLRTCLRDQPPIPFALRCALVVKDALREQTHTFLVPDQGFGDLVKLHERLYTGILASELRLHIPYIPHITVATSPDALLCKRIADEINEQPINIMGTIAAIDLIHVANGAVITDSQFKLG